MKQRSANIAIVALFIGFYCLGIAVQKQRQDSQRYRYICFSAVSMGTSTSEDEGFYEARMILLISAKESLTDVTTSVATNYTCYELFTDDRAEHPDAPPRR